MNIRILNRDFTHPADDWYQIEAKGEHPNARAKLVQIIDDQACKAMADAFNREAAKPGFAGMLIDIEHFKHDDNKETRAYGWLMKLENRADGLYGQIRWSGTGKKAVDDGDYRFFSTEYDVKDLAVLNKGESPKKVRPMKLDGLTLTNVNNNKGQKPITNRDMNTQDDPEKPEPGEANAASKAAMDASNSADTAPQHESAAVLHRKAAKLKEADGKETTAKFHTAMAEHHDCLADGIRNGVKNRQFPPGSAGSEHQQTQVKNKNMKSVLKLLGLAEDASEEAALDAVHKIKNRAIELEGHIIEADLATYADRIDPKQKEFVKSWLVTNREKTIEFLKSAPKLATAPAQVHNRGGASAPAGDVLNAEQDEQTAASAIRAGIRELRVQNRGMSYSAAHDELRRQKPELFGLKKRNEK